MTMKNIILALLIALGLGGGLVAGAQSSYGQPEKSGSGK
jgi:hypothetical protein